MLKTEMLRWLIVLVMARRVRGGGEHGGEGWSKGDVIQLVALLVGIPTVLGAVIACVAHFKKNRRTEIESNPSDDVESVTPPRTTESLTQGMESEIRMPRTGSEVPRLGSTTTSISLAQHSTSLSQYSNHQSVATDGVSVGLVTPRSLPGFQSGGVGRRRHTEDSAARTTLPACSGTVPRVVHPTLRVNQTGCGQSSTDATNSQGIHELASWFRNEYDRSNSQIMAERDAWACELRQSTADERSVEPDEDNSER